MTASVMADVDGLAVDDSLVAMGAARGFFFRNNVQHFYTALYCTGLLYVTNGKNQKPPVTAFVEDITPGFVNNKRNK